MMDGWYGGMGTGDWILMTLLWVVLVAAIVWAAAQLFPGRPGRAEGARDEDAEEILDRRLARGEIDADTYDTLREKLLGARLARR
jgi:putative membrane protein